MKRNIGIFLGMAPNTLQGNQGITQLLLHLLRSEEFRKRVVIALPSWTRTEFNVLLKDIPEINKLDLEFIYSRKKKPLLFTFINLIKNKKIKISSLKKHRHYFQKAFHFMEAQIIRLAAWNFAIFIILAPPLLVFFIIYKLTRLIILNRSKKSKAILKKITLYFKNNIISKIKNNRITHRIIRKIQENELNKLIRKMNSRHQIEIWYIPTAVLHCTNKINGKKIFAIPDIVFCEFSLLFFDLTYEDSYNTIKKNLSDNAEFICYSNNVKINHIKSHQVNENKIHVLKHGCTDLSRYLKNESWTTSAINLLQEYQETHLHSDPYLSDYHFPSARFIFYSSQVRPHKNILTLVKAYEVLLRKRYINIKLFITGNLKHDPNLHEYVYKQGLQNDVITFYNVSNEMLASLYHLAYCSVNPSLFEGGFPFTFCEAYSVGTPSLMSSISVTLEECKDDELNKVMLFDPFSVEDLANKIEWAITNKNNLYRMQRSLYENFNSRRWNTVSNEYLQLFDHIINQKQTNANQLKTSYLEALDNA